jgi:GDPmannose 4,6-dehydratase
LATGVTTEIRNFVKMSFEQVGVNIDFRGEGENEEGFVVSCTGEYQLPEGKVVVKVDPRYYRPTEVELLIGDPTKANEKLGWLPKYDLQALVTEMVASDLDLFKKEKHLRDNGFAHKNEFEN